MMPESGQGYILIPESKMSSQGEMPDVFHLEACRGHDLFEISADKLQHLFSTEALSSVEYVTFCLERIRKVQLHH
jgi:amidase